VLLSCHRAAALVVGRLRRLTRRRRRQTLVLRAPAPSTPRRTSAIARALLVVVVDGWSAPAAPAFVRKLTWRVETGQLAVGRRSRLGTAANELKIRHCRCTRYPSPVLIRLSGWCVFISPVVDLCRMLPAAELLGCLVVFSPVMGSVAEVALLPRGTGHGDRPAQVGTRALR